MEMQMNICVTVNSKYMRYLYVMLVSLYENNRNGSIHLYVIQRDFTKEDKKTIKDLTDFYQNDVEYIWVDEHKFDNFPINKGERKNLSLEIYFRLLIPELIPQSIDRVLLMDVDIIVNKSIEELCFVDLEGKCFGAAPNMCHNFKVIRNWRKWYPAGRTDWTHYNTGILLWNLRKIRQAYPKEYMFQKAQKLEIGIETFEEELFNVLFGEHDILKLDFKRWNYIVTQEDVFVRPNFKQYATLEELREKCAIIHYAALNPWETGKKNAGFSLWWEYAKKTPYYEIFLEEQRDRTEKYINELLKDKASLENAELDRIVDTECREAFARLEGNPKLERFLNQSEKPFYIWGAGDMGERLYRLFMSVHMEKKLWGGVVDENKTGLFHNFRICGYEELEKRFQGKGVLIITPVKQQHRLAFEIDNCVPENVRAVALIDFLKEAEDFSDK